MQSCDVNGDDAHEIFKYLRSHTKQLEYYLNDTETRQVPWNFCKWIVDKDGEVLMYLDPSEPLEKSKGLIVAMLNQTKFVRQGDNKMTKEEYAIALAKSKKIMNDVIDSGMLRQKAHPSYPFIFNRSP